MPYGLTYQGPPNPDDEQDAASRQVAEIMASLGITSPGLEMEPPPQAPMPPQRVGAGRDIIGSIGDALLTMATVRAGGAPPEMGPFAAGRREQQKSYEGRLMEFQKRQIENEQANRTLRNSARMMFAKPRAQSTRVFKSEVTRDINGENYKFVQFFDPEGNFLGEKNMGLVGYAPVIEPGMEIDPATGKPKAGFIRIPKSGEGATMVTGAGGRQFEPQPPVGLVTETGGKIGVLGRIPEVMNVFNIATQAVGGSEGMLRQTKNWALGKAAQTSAGPIVAPEPLVNYYASVKSVLFPIVKAGSGMVFPEAELARWEARFPIPGVDTPNEAEHKWNVIIQEMISDIQAKYGAVGRTAPIGAAPQTTDSLLEELWSRGP